MGVVDGDFVRVTLRRGSIELRAQVSHRETPGTCFIPFHFREAAANLLTIDEIDPFGRSPSSSSARSASRRRRDRASALARGPHGDGG